MTSEKDNFSGSKFRSLALGAVLIIVGGLILLGQLFRINIWGFLWPFFIIIPGALIYSLGLVKGGSSGEGAIIPGSIITMVGVLLLYQNTFNQFLDQGIYKGFSGIIRSNRFDQRGRTEGKRTG